MERQIETYQRANSPNSNPNINPPTTRVESHDAQIYRINVNKMRRNPQDGRSKK
jgi:hypothetical protein